MIKSSVFAILSVALIGLITVVFTEGNFFASEIFISYLYSAILGLINFFVAILLFSVGIKFKENSKFLKYILGGMVFRIFFLIFILFMLIKFLNIEKSSFILQFFIIYFVLLFIEIIFYLKTLKRESGKNVFSGSN